MQQTCRLLLSHLYPLPGLLTAVLAHPASEARKEAGDEHRCYLLPHTLRWLKTI